MAQGTDPIVSCGGDIKKEAGRKPVRLYIRMTQGNDPIVSSAKVIVHDRGGINAQIVQHTGNGL